LPQPTSQISRKPAPKPSATQPARTRTRILDAAETLFAERGFESVSLRHITAAADVNLASVNYHFGSKEALIDEVIARRVQPINQRRLALLDECRAASDEPLTPEVLVECFIMPVLDTAGDSADSGRPFSRLMSRCMAEGTDRFSDVLIKQFTEVIARFVREMSRTLPGVPAEIHQLRILFMAGSMSHALFNFDKLAAAAGSGPRTPDMSTLKAEMIAFIASGLSAPSSKQP
jgi:AcrR family transcriptional regulator